MRKFAHLDATPEEVGAIFGAVERWPEWMPGVRSVEIRERSAERLLVDLRQELRGRAADQVMELRLGPRGIRQRQVAGWFKNWDAEWGFAAPPDGGGTTVSLSVDFELGLAGLLMPRPVVQSLIDDIFADVIGAAQARIQEQRAEDRRRLEEGEGERLLEVFEGPQGLEIWVGERRYLVPAAE